MLGEAHAECAGGATKGWESLFALWPLVLSPPVPSILLRCEIHEPHSPAAGLAAVLNTAEDAQSTHLGLTHVAAVQALLRISSILASLVAH